MDPNGTLVQLREIANNPERYTTEEAADVIDSLDTWLSKGGYLPVDWASNHLTVGKR